MMSYKGHGFKYCFLALTVQFNSDHYFVHALNSFIYCYRNATDPQPNLSNTFKINKVWYLFVTREIWTIWTGRSFRRSDLTWPADWSDRGSILVITKVECCISFNHFSCQITESSAIRVLFSSIMGCHVRLTGRLFGVFLLPFSRNVVGVFYSPRRLCVCVCVYWTNTLHW